MMHKSHDKHYMVKFKKQGLKRRNLKRKKLK